jgi:hypothetical protein
MSILTPAYAGQCLGLGAVGPQEPGQLGGLHVAAVPKDLQGQEPFPTALCPS